MFYILYPGDCYCARSLNRGIFHKTTLPKTRNCSRNWALYWALWIRTSVFIRPGLRETWALPTIFILLKVLSSSLLPVGVPPKWAKSDPELATVLRLVLRGVVDSNLSSQRYERVGSKVWFWYHPIGMVEMSPWYDDVMIPVMLHRFLPVPNTEKRCRLADIPLRWLQLYKLGNKHKVRLLRQIREESESIAQLRKAMAVTTSNQKRRRGKGHGGLVVLYASRYPRDHDKYTN